MCSSGGLTAVAHLDRLQLHHACSGIITHFSTFCHNVISLPVIQLKFDDMNGKVSYEWLYRGNFRLLPIYEETQRRKVRMCRVCCSAYVCSIKAQL